MQKEFIPYEQALQLKELGFQEECVGLYDVQKRLFNRGTYKFVEKETNVLAPLYQQVIDWARKSHIYANLYSTRDWHNYYKIIRWYPFGDSSAIYQSLNIPNYEEAKKSCINQIIEIIKKEKL